MTEYAVGDLVTFTKSYKEYKNSPDLLGKRFEVVNVELVDDKHIIFANHTQYITIVVDGEEIMFSGTYFEY